MINIKQLLAQSLSGNDVLDLVKNKANLLTYPELINYKNIDDCLGKYGALILLYETKQNYGHWVCVIRHDANNIEFFDSYGCMPDDELKFIPDHFKKISNQYFSFLTLLLYNSGAIIEYNHDKLQQLNNNIATCGRHVATRINLRNIPLKKYVKLMTQDKLIKPDMIVTYITAK